MFDLDRIGHWAESLWSPGDTLSQRAAQSGVWVFALQGATRVARFIRTIILARLLSPEDFGLMGLALLAVSTLSTFTQTGFSSALIQRRERVEGYLDTAWTFSILRALLLSVALLLAAPFLGGFFDEPAAAPIIRVVAISVLLRGLENIGMLHFQRDLEFAKTFVFEMSSILAELTVVLVSAFLLRSVWALVLGLLAERVARVVASYLIHPYRPTLRLDLGKASQLFGYGKWLSLSHILIFVGSRGDDLVVGKVIGTAGLGLYQLAYKISQPAVTDTTYVIERAAFPTYAKLQGEQTRLRNAYFRIASVSLALSVPAALGILVLGGDFVRLFLGDDWLAMIPAVRILALAALLKSIASTGSPLFKGSGRPQFEFHMQLARAATVGAFIIPFSLRWGIAGGALTVVLSGVSMLAVWYVRITRLLEPHVRDWISAFGPTLVGSVALLISTHLFGGWKRALLLEGTGGQMVWFAMTASVAVALYVLAFSLSEPLLSKHRVVKEVVEAIKR